MDFRSLAVGMPIPELSKGPLNTGHIVRWSAAIENWHPIHYDRRLAVETEGQQDVLVNGSWKQQLLLQVVTDWLGSDGWLLRFGVRYRRPNIPGDTLTGWGKVTQLREVGGFGLVDLELGLRDGQGNENTQGTATLVLPLEGGPALPYPFDPALLEA